MIALGCDHGGFGLKEEIKKYFDEKQIAYKDFGTTNPERTDYPIYAKSVCESIQNKECDKGILICTTGVGMSMAANKYKGIRAGICFTEEGAKKAREHSDINVLALSAEDINISKAVPIIRMWLATEFLGGRYLDRIQMIEEIEKENMK